MTVQKKWTWILLVMLIMGLCPLAAQEGGDPDSEGEDIILDTDWYKRQSTMYTRGDQMFSINLGVIFPVLFRGNDGTMENNVNIGGTGSLSYDYFFTSHFAIGGEVSGMFASTLGENMLYIIPIGLRLSYQFTVYDFEFPITLALGVAPQKYLDRGYVGFFIKPSLGVFWRFNPDWSFGLNSSWWWIPEWTKDSGENGYGNFVTLTIAARYHF